MQNCIYQDILILLQLFARATRWHALGLLIYTSGGWSTLQMLDDHFLSEVQSAKMSPSFITHGLSV